MEHRPGKDVPHADALSRRHEAEIRVSPSSETLRGGVCGVAAAVRHRPGKSVTSESRKLMARVKPRGPHLRLGRVIDGRYLPQHLLSAIGMID